MNKMVYFLLLLVPFLQLLFIIQSAFLTRYSISISISFLNGIRDLLRIEEEKTLDSCFDYFFLYFFSLLFYIVKFALLL
jgi:hypothetical protein